VTQDRQCTYKVILLGFRVTIFDVQMQKLLDILSVCLWPYLSSLQCACAVLYCRPWPVWVYSTVTNRLKNRTIVENKNLLNMKFMYRISLQLLSETFLVQSNII